MHQPYSKVIPKRRSRQCIGAAQIPLHRIKKLKKADYVPENRIDALKGNQYTCHTYRSKIEHEILPKWPIEQCAQIRIPEFGHRVMNSGSDRVHRTGMYVEMTVK
jgi:hypothetical protein